jgi:uncharacterized protein
VSGDWGYERVIAGLAAAPVAGLAAADQEIYAPHAGIWHNDDLLEQAVQDNLEMLQALDRPSIRAGREARPA